MVKLLSCSDKKEEVRQCIQNTLIFQGMIVLTRVHDCSCPHFLDVQATYLPSLILVNSTSTVVLLVLWLNVTIVNTVSKLKILKPVLHSLL